MKRILGEIERKANKKVSQFGSGEGGQKIKTSCQHREF